MYASGASGKEALLVSIANNFIFEYIIEGTYAAPSGLDLLMTTAGCVTGYLATKYVLKKPFGLLVKTSGKIKEKLNMDFNMILQPGESGEGMKIGSQVIFNH
jgi:hypothetical protein